MTKQALIDILISDGKNESYLEMALEFYDPELLKAYRSDFESMNLAFIFKVAKILGRWPVGYFGDIWPTETEQVGFSPRGFQKQVGAELIALRNAKLMRVADFAKLFDVQSVEYNRIESGELEVKIGLLNQIGEQFGLPFNVKFIRAYEHALSADRIKSGETFVDISELILPERLAQLTGYTSTAITNMKKKLHFVLIDGRTFYIKSRCLDEIAIIKREKPPVDKKAKKIAE